jgi:receptor protein-tyrosine kinase
VDLIGYLRLLRRRWWIISLAILVSVGASVFATTLQHKRYETSARLLVSGSSSLSAVDEITRRQLAQQRAVLFSQIATTTPVIIAAERAADGTGISPLVETANPSIGASASGNDPFLTITVSADSPQAAQSIANQFVNVLPPELAKLDQLPSAIKALLTVVNAAGLPSTPSSPKPERNILIGLALGIVLGIAAALIRETLDTTLRDSEEVRRLTAATILGVIPREFDDERLPAATRPHSRRSEAYRQVRTNIEFAADDQQAPRSFVVTSAGQGEGKSTTVGNLALLISRAGKRVAVVDADLRKPTLASLFNATSDYGLSDVLTGRRSLDSVLQSISGEQIVVLASGPNVSRPSELLSSAAMEHVLETLIAEYDLVIVDSPPVLAITDALLVGKHTDGMLLVTRMRRTTRSGLRRSLEAVDRVHARLLGIVVNAAIEAEDKRYGYTKGYGKGYLSDAEGTDAELHPTASTETAPVAMAVAEQAPPPPPPPPPLMEQPPPPVMEEPPPAPESVLAEEPAPAVEDDPEPVVEAAAPSVEDAPPVPVAAEEPAPPPPVAEAPEPVVAEAPPQVDEEPPALEQAPPPMTPEAYAPPGYQPPSAVAQPQVYLPPDPQVYLPPDPQTYPAPPDPQTYPAPPDPQAYLPPQAPPYLPPQAPPYLPPQAPPEPQAYPPSAAGYPPPPPPPPAAYQPPARQPRQPNAGPNDPPPSWQPTDGLEQPQPTFRPPAGSEGAMSSDAVARAGGRRRRARGKRHAEDEVRQRGDAG